MKHLISATLSMEAGQVWESWPVKSKKDVGRSATLSILMVDNGELLLRQTHRRRILSFLADNPPIDGALVTMFANMIWEMNEDLDGSIHHDPIQTGTEPTS